MRADKIGLVLFWAVCMLLWGQSVWGRWADAAYERHPEDSIFWFWLRVFDVPRTRQNCVAFVKLVSVIGMIFVTTGTVAVLLWGE